MSATTIFAFEVSITDLLKLKKTDELARQIGNDYCNCMLTKFGLEKNFVEVGPVAISELDMVELDGPWESVCWIGASTLTIGTGVKWGVFLSDSDERASVLREVTCLASSFHVSSIVGFSSGSSAYDLATAGVALSAIKEKLSSELGVLRFDACLNSGIGWLVDEIGQMEEKLEFGFFEIHIRCGDSAS